MNRKTSSQLRLFLPIFIFTILLITFIGFDTSWADEDPHPQLPASASQAPYLVKDINTYTHGIEIYNPVEMDGVFYFVTLDWYYGTILYRSDGTEAGTSLLWILYPDLLYDPTRLAVLNGSLYFAAYDKVTGYELYKSDGTVGGTALVKDINSEGDGLPVYTDMLLAVFNGLLFFSADDGTTGNELWVTDGTEAGTRLVKDIAPNISGVPPIHPIHTKVQSLTTSYSSLLMMRCTGLSCGRRMAALPALSW